MLAKSVLIFYLCKLYLLIIPNKQVLGTTEDDLIKKVLAAQPRLLPTKIARDGSIMEWVLILNLISQIIVEGVIC